MQKPLIPGGGDSRERVAFDLAQLIAQHEISALAAQMEEPRKYYLDLYAECLHIVNSPQS